MAFAGVHTAALKVDDIEAPNAATASSGAGGGETSGNGGGDDGTKRSAGGGGDGPMIESTFVSTSACASVPCSRCSPLSSMRTLTSMCCAIS